MIFLIWFIALNSEDQRSNLQYGGRCHFIFIGLEDDLDPLVGGLGLLEVSPLPPSRAGRDPLVELHRSA